MFFRSLHIQRFKSLADVKLENLAPATILVGQNAAGKSNIVEAIRFLISAFRDGLDNAITNHEGIEVIRQFSKSKPYDIRFRIEFDIGHYELVIASKDRTYYVKKESGQWTRHTPRTGRDANDLVFQFERDAAGNISSNQDTANYGYRAAKADIAQNELAAIAMPFFPIGRSQLSFLSLYPNTLRTPHRPDTDTRLKSGGENWASVLKSMRTREHGKIALAAIIAVMKKVMPGLEDITVKSIGGYLVPQFLFRETPHSAAHYFDPVQLSDGTLRVLGILLALYQQPPASFIAIEEPEQNVNPAVLGLLADAIKEASKSTQILVTTHSPNLIDHFKPENIRVVDMRKGETIVSGIRLSQLKTVNERLMSIGEIMTLDGLQPELHA